MYVRQLTVRVVGIVLLSMATASAEPVAPLTLAGALRQALNANPRLTAVDRDVGIATGRRLQAGALPNPEISAELDNAFGTGDYRGTRSAETTLQLSQLVELGGKRQARVAAGVAEISAAGWQRAAVRLEILSETAVAFFNVLGAQNRARIYAGHVASIDRLLPLLQRRVDAGASPPAETARARVAADLVRAERERAATELALARRELAALMAVPVGSVSGVVGDLTRVGRPPTFQALVRAVDDNPQLVRFTALRAQRDAELLSARLKPVPDLRLSAGWRHYRETGDDAVRLGLSIPIPVFDQNRGGILEAEEALAKTGAERAAGKAALLLALGRAYDTLSGARRELDILRGSALPAIRTAVDGMESGYGQGRFTLLELLDVQNAATEAALREQDVLIKFHVAIATIEGLTGSRFALISEKSR